MPKRKRIPIVERQLSDIRHWIEVLPGIYVFPIPFGAHYEIQILSRPAGVPLAEAFAVPYLVGTWHEIPENVTVDTDPRPIERRRRKSIFSRECIADCYDVNKNRRECHTELPPWDPGNGLTVAGCLDVVVNHADINLWLDNIDDQ